jgi:hypothetical protein
MILEISHLVTNGCSFTWGQGLEDRENTNWSALLAKKLGVPVVNLSAPGAGCDRIFRTTAEYYHKNKTHNNKPFYLISWSCALRREEFLAEENDYKVVNLAQPATILSKEFIINMTKEGLISYERKKMLYWSSTMALLRSENTPYLMTDNMVTTRYTREQIHSFYPYVHDYIFSDPNKITDFMDLTTHFPKLPCGHDTAETQHILADFAYEEIKKRYSEIRVVEAEYTKQSSFNTYVI